MICILWHVVQFSRQDPKARYSLCKPKSGPFNQNSIIAAVPSGEKLFCKFIAVSGAAAGRLS